MEIRGKAELGQDLGAGDWNCFCSTKQTQSKTKSWIWVQASPSRPVSLSTVWLFWALLGIFIWFFEMSNFIQLQTRGEQLHQTLHLWHCSGHRAGEKPKSWGFLSTKASGNLWGGQILGSLCGWSISRPSPEQGRVLNYIPGGTNCWTLVSSVARVPEQLFLPGSHLRLSLSCSELLLGCF